MLALNPQSPLVAYADMITSIYQRNYDGALENARWSSEQLGRPPFMLRIAGYINVVKGDYEAARKVFEESDPGFFDRSGWRQAIEQGASDACTVSLLLQRTGDPQLAEGLARTALDYLENELPGYVEHVDRYNSEECHLVLGQEGAALDVLVTRLDHRHYSFWWLIEATPHLRPLQAEPRLVAALQRTKEDIALQRAELIENETASL
jgi:hypothetical protein